MEAPSLDGRWFRSVSADGDAEVGPQTLFRYAEEDGEVWATYAGGAVRRGYLVGTRDGDRLDARYVQLSESGQTSAGHCVSIVGALPDGRLRLAETWRWESRKGAGTSVAEEIPDDADGGSDTETGTDANMDTDGGTDTSSHASSGGVGPEGRRSVTGG